MEGYYQCHDTWAGPKPALVLQESRVTQRTSGPTAERLVYDVIEGDIVALDEEGVTFTSIKEPRGTSQHYTFDRVAVVIDENGDVVHGVIPRKFSRAFSMELWLDPSMVYSSGSKPYKVVMEPNQPFAFCLPAGRYKISKIVFKDKSNNVQLGHDFPELTIRLDDGYANYIGNLCVIHERDELADSITIRDRVLIPYTFRAGSDPMAGFFFGGAGAALIEASTPSEHGRREVLIGIDKDYRPECKSPLKENIIKIGG
jgi:hypothetical protein